jgi:hypothetical protein
MAKAPAPIEHRGDRRRHGGGGVEPSAPRRVRLRGLLAFANGCARSSRVVGQGTTSWTPECGPLAITRAGILQARAREQKEASGSPTISPGDRLTTWCRRNARIPRRCVWHEREQQLADPESVFASAAVGQYASYS